MGEEPIKHFIGISKEMVLCFPWMIIFRDQSIMTSSVTLQFYNKICIFFIVSISLGEWNGPSPYFSLACSQKQCFYPTYLELSKTNCCLSYDCCLALTSSPASINSSSHVKIIGALLISCDQKVFHLLLFQYFILLFSVFFHLPIG